MGSSGKAVGCALAMLALSGLAPTESGAQEDTGTAEALVRGVWFEGLPLDRAAALDRQDGERLAEMLSDPSEAPHHANVVMALGACACGPAFERLAAFDRFRSPPDGANAGVGDYETQAALRALPQAMGLLARRDQRALAWLEAKLAEPAAFVDRAGRQRRIALMQGLALSRAPRASALLADLEAAARSDGDAALTRRAAQARKRFRRDAELRP